jgi:2-dehydropantoate 2-reductase
MRILILGAGGTGGYFGGRLAEAGVDVTFLVRPVRAAQLAADGLVIRSPLGDVRVAVQHVSAEQLPALAAARPFDMILLSCKAYDLDSSMDAIAPAVGAGTSVLPILNGLWHYPALDQRFGAQHVLGGLCFISATKHADGAVVHLNDLARVTFGEREGDPQSARCLALAAAFEKAGVQHKHAQQVGEDTWVKYSFLAALAAGTCLMRGAIGQIVAAQGGQQILEGLYGECLAVAQASGWPIPQAEREKALHALTDKASPITASMLRDIEAGQNIEGLQIVGDMLQKAQAARLDAPLLTVAWAHLQVYSARRVAHPAG